MRRPHTFSIRLPAHYVALCVGAVSVFALCVLVMLLEPGSAKVRTFVIEVVLLLLAVGLVLACRRTARRAPGYNQRVWHRFTVSAVFWVGGRALILANHQLSDAPIGHSWADLFLLVALVFVVRALAAIPPEERPRAERLQAWLGISVVLAAVLLLCRSLVVALPPPQISEGFLAGLVQLVYPTAHLVVACAVWVVLLRVGIQARAPLFLVTAALLGYAAANVYWAYYAGTGRGHAREVLDAGTAWCYLLFLLATLSPHAPNPRQPPTQVSKSRYIAAQSLVVYGPVMVSAVAVAGLAGIRDPWVVATGLLVLLLFGVRLMLLSVDNSRLRDDLQSRVDDLEQRTTDLRRLGLQTERIVQSVVDGVIGVDAQGLVTFVNPAAAAMLGLSREDLLGKSEHELFHGQDVVGCEPLRDCCIVATAMFAGTAAASVNEYFVAADGRIFPVELAVGPILEDERITGAVVVFRDASERRKIEKMKNEFVSVVSHELRTPLTSIRGSLGLLAGGAAGSLTQQGERMVKVALESSERLTRLINDMLDIERIESGTIPVLLTDCDPEDLISHAVEELRGLTADHRIEMEAHCAGTLVCADADRIVQTLTNLIGNAVKFSPSGTPITIAAASRGSVVEFSVTDQGRGIPADKIGRIFERFEQVDSSDSREMGGTGLGLAISRTIVRRHGGELWATSEMGRGSVFRFTLPVAGVASSALIAGGGVPSAPPADTAAAFGAAGLGRPAAAVPSETTPERSSVDREQPALVREPARS
ncbi:MAG TPA: ATP-binding protein [Propionibacteriaceae bacterium]